jgi:hypothetical protein
VIEIIEQRMASAAPDDLEKFVRCRDGLLRQQQRKLQMEANLDRIRLADRTRRAMVAVLLALGILLIIPVSSAVGSNPYLSGLLLFAAVYGCSFDFKKLDSSTDDPFDGPSDAR